MAVVGFDVFEESDIDIAKIRFVSSSASAADNNEELKRCLSEIFASNTKPVHIKTMNILTKHFNGLIYQHKISCDMLDT